MKLGPGTLLVKGADGEWRDLGEAWGFKLVGLEIIDRNEVVDAPANPLTGTLKLIDELREYEMAGVEAAESMRRLTYVLEQKGRPKKVAQWKQDPRQRFRA